MNVINLFWGGLFSSALLLACTTNESVIRHNQQYEGLTQIQTASDGSVFISGTSMLRTNTANARQPGGITIEDNAFIDALSLWPNKSIYTCWENPKPEHDNMRAVVQTAINETWQKYSSLEILGWLECVPSSTGIRILVDDTASNGPHVKTLGRYLNKVPSGMVLNFDYNNWGNSCLTSLKLSREKCTFSIAVHEFGLALGFAHEQNRADKPGECKEEAQGPDGTTTYLTSWDLDSVMNYCSPEYNNNGKLSALDIHALRCAYDRETYDCKLEN